MHGLSRLPLALVHRWERALRWPLERSFLPYQSKLESDSYGHPCFLEALLHVESLLDGAQWETQRIFIKRRGERRDP